jgi:hypothetical protein
MAEALQTAREIKVEYSRAEVLGSLAERLPEPLKVEVLAEALQAAREIKDEGRRANVLGSLAKRLPEPLKAEVLAEALQAAREIKDEGRRAKALVALADCLPEPLKAEVLAEALQVVRGIEDKYNRSNALGGLLAERLPENAKIQILKELLYISGLYLKAWQSVQFKTLDEHLMLYMQFSAQKNRQDGLKVVSALIPVLVHFSGEEIVPELWRAIQDTARWWP